MAVVEAGAAVHKDVPPHSWALLVLYPTKTRGSSIQGRAGMVTLSIHLHLVMMVKKAYSYSSTGRPRLVVGSSTNLYHYWLLGHDV
jgi:hypothetical protein